MAAARSHAAVLQERLDVLGVAGGRGQRRAAILSVCGFSGGGRTGGRAKVLRDENGDEHGEDHGARPEQEGRARDGGALRETGGNGDL